MTHVVTEACINCRYTDCVSVCPVECFHRGPNFLVIDPDVCIDCAICVPECPVDAIVADFDLPAAQVEFLDINVRLAAQWPVISTRDDAMADAEAWKDVAKKRELLVMD